MTPLIEIGGNKIKWPGNLSLPKGAKVIPSNELSDSTKTPATAPTGGAGAGQPVEHHGVMIPDSFARKLGLTPKEGVTPVTPSEQKPATAPTTPVRVSAPAGGAAGAGESRRLEVGQQPARRPEAGATSANPSPKVSENPPRKEIHGLKIEIGNKTYVLSDEAQRYLKREFSSEYKHSRSVVILNEPHDVADDQFRLFQGLEIFFRDNPELVRRTIFLSEGSPANQPISVQPLIQEEPHPSDELIRQVLSSFLITGYMAYEWKYHQGIPTIGVEDYLRYEMGRVFTQNNQGAMGMTIQELEKLPYFKQWVFSVVIRNKKIAETLLANINQYENPMLFIGALHLLTLPREAFRQIKALAQFGIHGPFHEYAGYVDNIGEEENLGICDLLKREKVGFTFLNSVSGNETREEAERYTRLFDAKHIDYERYITDFLSQLGKRGTTVKPSPKAAAELVRRLKEGQRKTAVIRSGIIYNTSLQERGQQGEWVNWFRTSPEEERKKIREKYKVDSIWELPFAIRGKVYDEVLRDAYPGSNLEHVDDIRRKARTVTGMKTIELRDKTYQDVKELDRRVRECIDELSEYPGGVWKGVTFTRGDDFDDVYLEIGIPLGKATRVQVEKLLEMQDYAKTKNVTLVINEVP